MVDELYLQYLGIPASSDEAEEPEEDPEPPYVSSYVSVYVKPDPPPAQEPIPNDIVTFVPPIPQPKRQPKPVPQKPTVPLVIYTAFDTDKAEELKKRLENAPRPVHDKKQPKQKTKPDTVSIPDVAVPADFVQPEATPDISALDLEHSWSSEFRLHQLRLEHDCELVRELEIAFRHERMIKFYLDDPKACLKNFAEYGWDEESDELAEAYVEKYAEEMKLHYEGQDELWNSLAWGATEEVREDLTNDRLESAVVVNIVTKEEIFRRFGDEDETPLQEENREMIKDPNNTALVHNHWNDSPGSQADFDAALWLGVRYLIVVTPSGVQYIYERDGDTMKLLDEVFNRGHVALPSPVETAESREAYEAQALAEAGNPPERVMEQEELHWWQRENVVVPYKTTETKAQVAARMGIPVEYLEELNEGNAENNMMRIPLPGWYAQTIDEPWVSVAHTTGATFLDPGPLLERNQLISEWNALSPVEQQIEMALMGSDANIDRFVTFENAGHDFDYTLAWLQTHENAINQAASDFVVPSSLLNTVLGSELLYDYGDEDSQQDATMRSGFRDAALRIGEIVSGIEPRMEESWDGTGVANAHYPALIDAYHFVNERLAPGETHPWDLDPKAPDLASAPKLEPSDAEKSAYVEDWADYYKHRSFDELSQREKEVVLFWVRDGKLDEVPWDLQQDIAYYAASVVGTVRMAAMISHMYGETLEDIDNTANVAENPRDIARVWGRYRSANQYFDYLGNAHLAYPVADYWSKQ